MIALLADLEPELRKAAIERVVVLLDKPALGAFEPHLSRRRRGSRDSLKWAVQDLVSARKWKPCEPEVAA